MKIKEQLYSKIVNNIIIESDPRDIDEKGVFNCPEGVIEIGKKAFKKNDILTTLNLNQVRKIGCYAFWNCKNLTVINAPHLVIIGRAGFNDCEKLTHINLPNVNKIEDYGFADCMELTKVYAPQATNLGELVFYRCKKLNTINISNMIKIKQILFLECEQLTTLVLHPKIYFAYGIFRNYDSLQKISNIQQIIINNLQHTSFDEDDFISELPKKLKNVKIIVASEQVKSLCNVLEVLNQYKVFDTRKQILSLSSQLGFFSQNIEKRATSTIQEASFLKNDLFQDVVKYRKII